MSKPESFSEFEEKFRIVSLSVATFTELRLGLFFHLFFFMVFGLIIRHPVLWAHAIIAFASALFLWATRRNETAELITASEEKPLTIGVRMFGHGNFLSILSGIILAIISDPFLESVPAPFHRIHLVFVAIYFSSLAASLLSIGLITSGLYDVQGPETPGNAPTK